MDFMRPFPSDDYGDGGDEEKSIIECEVVDHALWRRNSLCSGKKSFLLRSNFMNE